MLWYLVHFCWFLRFDFMNSVELEADWLMVDGKGVPLQEDFPKGNSIGKLNCYRPKIFPVGCKQEVLWVHLVGPVFE